MTKTLVAAVFTLLVPCIIGCEGLRYSEMSPDTRNFHPRRIAVLPADTTAFAEAKGSIDRLFAEALTESRWFAHVVGGNDFRRLMEANKDLRTAVGDYLAKLRNVNYSDPELSGRIGELTGVEAFLLVRVDYWNYAAENDTKQAKVSLSISMVEARTGKILWKAAHHKISEYLIIKPDLPDVARNLVREMIGYMPH